MSDNNQVIEHELDGKKYKFSGLRKDDEGIFEFINPDEEKQLDGLDQVQVAKVIAQLYAEHLRQFPPADED
ncbi:MAG: hypothetical protein ACXABN_16250 [Candidatus Thorarchaeota archaeon]|jgi:hypothetical protein